MKFLSDHNVNIVMKYSGRVSANTILYAVMTLEGKDFHFIDIFDGTKKGSVQHYLRSVVYKFKRKYNRVYNWT